MFTNFSKTTILQFVRLPNNCPKIKDILNYKKNVTECEIIKKSYSDNVGSTL